MYRFNPTLRSIYFLSFCLFAQDEKIRSFSVKMQYAQTTKSRLPHGCQRTAVKEQNMEKLVSSRIFTSCQPHQVPSRRWGVDYHSRNMWSNCSTVFVSNCLFAPRDFEWKTYWGKPTDWNDTHAVEGTTTPPFEIRQAPSLIFKIMCYLRIFWGCISM